MTIENKTEETGVDVDNSVDTKETVDTKATDNSVDYEGALDGKEKDADTDVEKKDDGVDTDKAEDKAADEDKDTDSDKADDKDEGADKDKDKKDGENTEWDEKFLTEELKISEEDLPVLKEKFEGLSKDKIKDLMSFYEDKVKGIAELTLAEKAKQEAADKEQFDTQIKDLSTKYEESLKKDPEFGKDYVGNSVLAQEAAEVIFDEEGLEKYGKSVEMKSPYMKKALAKIGKMMKDDAMFQSGTKGKGEAKRDTYGNMIVNYEDKLKNKN